MEKETEDKLREQLTDNLKVTHVRGLAAGMRTVCAVIMGLCNNEKLTDEAKLLEIRKFCEVSLDKIKKENPENEV